MMQFERMLSMAEHGSKASSTMQKTIAERCVAWANHRDEFKELCVAKGVAMDEKTWRDWFMRGRFDSLLDEVTKKMNGKRAWTLKALVSEMTAHYHAQKKTGDMHAHMPVFDVSSEDQSHINGFLFFHGACQFSLPGIANRVPHILMRLWACLGTVSRA